MLINVRSKIEKRSQRLPFDCCNCW